MSDTHDPDLHQPTPEFAAHLEWQIRTALRRKTRFDEPVAAARPWWARVRAAAVLVGAVALGASAVLGAQQIRRTREGELLAQRQQVWLELSAVRLRSAQEERDQVERQFASGRITEHERDVVRARVSECQAELARREIDAFEVATTGREPDDSIAAPAVRGRDLVSERIELEMQARATELDVRRAEVARSEALHERGFLTDAELDQARAELARAQHTLAVLERRRELRSEVLHGGVDAQRAELLALRSDLEHALEARALELRSAESRLERTRLLVESGVAPVSEARAAERAIAEARAALTLTELERGLVEDKLGH